MLLGSDATFISIRGGTLLKLVERLTFYPVLGKMTDGCEDVDMKI